MSDYDPGQVLQALIDAKQVQYNQNLCGSQQVLLLFELVPSMLAMG
jgi:hypothetical protein